MKKIYIAALTLAAVLPVAAQDTYESARLLGSDLNGTARYVGMGGAMDALGADLSTISTNPAGIGLFRHSAVNVSFGLVSQQDAKKFDGLSTTNMSFDQAGFVYSVRSGRNSFVNFAFNYHKSRNFDQILSAANKLRDVSSNLITLEKHDRGVYQLDLDKNGYYVGYEGNSDKMSLAYSQLDDLNANTLYDDEVYEEGGKEQTWAVYNGMAADAFTFDRAHRGWISDFDFNLSGNVNDRFYWGVTVGIHDVRYRGYSEYSEGLRFLNGDDGGLLNYGDKREINGSGIDIKAGIIFRPVEESPFRIGLSAATPTWYRLTTSNVTRLENLSALGDRYDSKTGEWYFQPDGEINNSYDFRFYTPWKFGVSLGHTVGREPAIGAGFEYSDYGASQNRINDGRYYDSYYDTYYDRSHTDNLMKQHTERTLKGVCTFKVGAELKPVPEFAVRLGYNFLTAAYQKDGVRDVTLQSNGVSYASTYDYTNWEGTHRITAGLGYKLGGMNIDLAYQYSGTNGKFYPLQPNLTGTVDATSVSMKRHQVLLTLGYTF